MSHFRLCYVIILRSCDLGDKADPSTTLLEYWVDPSLQKVANLVEKADPWYLVGIQGLIP